MENFNVCEVLRNARPGIWLWSDGFGWVIFQGVRNESSYPICVSNKQIEVFFTEDGKMADRDDVPCSLWPSREVRAWKKWGEVLLKVGDFVNDSDGNTYVIKEKKRGDKNANYIGNLDTLVCLDKDGELKEDVIGNFTFASVMDEDFFIQSRKGEDIQSCLQADDDTTDIEGSDDELLSLDKCNVLMMKANKLGIWFIMSLIKEKLNDKNSTNVGKLCEIRKIINNCEKIING